MNKRGEVNMTLSEFKINGIYMNKLLLNTDYLLRNNYLEQFGDMESAEKDNALEKWLFYEKEMSIDLDTSLEAVLVYWMLFSIYNQENLNAFETIKAFKGKQYEFTSINGVKIRGDWLTSPKHVIKLYMSFLWESEKKNENSSVRDFYSLFDNISSQKVLIPRTDTWLKYYYTNAKTIWKAFGKEARNFVNNSMMSGNFIGMPIYINPSRCGNVDDTVDNLLWKIYCYYHLKDNEQKNYLKNALKGQYDEKAKENFIKWLEYFKHWNNFVEYNYMQSFVCSDLEGYGKPISLKTGNEICCKIGRKYQPMPQNKDEMDTMLYNYNVAVEDRTRRIFCEIVKNKQILLM